MQSVTMTVVNSGTIEERYRKGDLEFKVSGSSSKSVELTLPTDADFIVWLASKSDLAGTITYGQNSDKTVELKTADYSVDALDGTVIMTATVPQEILLPLHSTMFDGVSAGGVGNIIQLKRASSGVLNTQTTSPDTIDDNAHVTGVAGYLTGHNAPSVIGVFDIVTDGAFACTVDNVAIEVTGIDFTAAHADGIVLDLDGVAARVQSELRLVTGGLETVVYSTDHFVFTSAVAKVSGNFSVLATIATPAGTDISGVGTAYLDAETAVGTATAGIGGYAFAAAGSIHLQAVDGGWQTVGGTTAFA